jgi:hypothetical protein
MNNKLENPLKELSVDEIGILWEAVSQYYENNQETHPVTGDEIENPVLENLVEKLDAFYAGNLGLSGQVFRNIQKAQNAS